MNTGFGWCPFFIGKGEDVLKLFVSVVYFFPALQLKPMRRL
jgi:hypothetical protein